MNLPREYYPVIEMNYRRLIGNQKLTALIAKERLLSFKPDQIHGAGKKNTITHYEQKLVTEIISYFNDAVFFHDEQTLNKLKEFKLSSNVLRWFVNLSPMQDQFEIIRKHNIGIDTFYGFTLIRDYLNSKFKNEMYMYFKTVTHDNVRMSPLSKQIIKAKQKRKYYGPEHESKKFNFDTILDGLINHGVEAIGLLELSKNEPGMKTFFRLSRGNTESLILSKFVKECFFFDEKAITSTKFLGIIYDLLSLLILDRIFISETDFLNSHKRLYQSYKSFDAYKAKKIRSILFPK